MTVPITAIIFLGVTVIVVIILIVFFLFLNKKACFHDIGGFPCLERARIRDSEKLPFAEDSDDSDEEVRANFERLQNAGHDQVDANIAGSNKVLSHASASIAETLQSSIFDGRPSKLTPSTDVRSEVSARSALTAMDKSVVSSAQKTAVSGAGKSVASYPEKSVVSGTGKSVLSYTGKSMMSQDSGDYTLTKDDEGSDSSEPLSDASSVTQYSEEYGDAPQGLTNLSDLSDEDKKDAEVRPTARVSTLGVLGIAISYEAKKARLTIRVREARDVPDPSQGGTTSYQLHLVLLPERRQRHKTKLRAAAKLVFEESFVFSRVSPSTVGEHALRVRLYGCERRRRERLVAETVVALATFGLQSEEKLFEIPLEPRTKLKSRKFVAELQPVEKGTKEDSCPPTPNKRTGESGSDSDSLVSLRGVVPHGNNLPELLVGLSYNGTTGLLTVEIIKGSAFRLPNLARPPDAYVKMNLIASSGQEVNRSKTSIRRNDPNPLFKEKFRFQMAMFQLNDLTLMIFVYHKKSINRKQSIGWFSLGYNSSGDEEVLHWKDMKEALGDRVVRWHLLLEPT